MAVSLSGMTLHTNNDNESNWSGTDGSDTYNNSIQGSNSESWQVSKNNSETGTLSSSSALNTTRGLFVFWMSSNLAPYYTDIRLELQSTNNNYKQFIVATSSNKAIGGNFVASAVDYINNGTSTGTFAPASFSVLRLIVDNSSSGNIRSVINNWIDAMYYGPGHTISGTTTSDTVFAEATAVDEATANKYGILQNYNGIIYTQGDLDLSGTSLTSDSETLVFVDTPNGYSTYQFDITGTVTFTNTAVIAAGTIDYDFDSSSATSFTVTGGSFSGYKTFVTAASQTISGVVFQAGSTATIANTISTSTFNQCGTITISGAGKLDTCTINSSTSASSVICANLDDVSGCTFDSDGSNHAVELNSIGTGSMTWDCTTTNYDSGSTGSPVTPTSTGNESIYVNVGSGTLTISVASGATIPSIRSAGATVNVISGGVDIDVNVKNQSGANITGALVYIDEDLVAAGNITNTTTNSSGDISTASYTGTATSATLRVRKYGYKPFIGTITLLANSATNVILITDPQQI